MSEQKIEVTEQDLRWLVVARDEVYARGCDLREARDDSGSHRSFRIAASLQRIRLHLDGLRATARQGVQPGRPPETAPRNWTCPDYGTSCGGALCPGESNHHSRPPETAGAPSRYVEIDAAAQRLLQLARAYGHAIASNYGGRDDEVDEHREALWSALLEELQKDRTLTAGQRPCFWTEDLDGLYETGCGNRWFFDSGTATENKARFCMYCGAPLVDKTVRGARATPQPGAET